MLEAESRAAREQAWHTLAAWCLGFGFALGCLVGFFGHLLLAPLWR